MKINLFNNISKNVSELFTKRTKEEMYFSKKFNNFIIVEDYLFCVKMMDEGYTPSDFERKQINEIVLNKLQKNDYNYNDIRFLKSLSDKTRIEGLLKAVPNIETSFKSCNRHSINFSLTTKMINKETTLNQEEFIMTELDGNKKMVLEATKELISHSKKMYRKGLDSHGDYCNYNTREHNYRTEKLEKLINLNIFIIRAGLYIPEEINELKQQFESLNKYIERKTSKKFSAGSYTMIGKDMIEGFAKTLTNYAHKSDIESKEDLLRQIKSYSTRNKSLSEEIKDLINQEEYSIDKLPVEAKNKISTIQKVITEINSEETTQFFNERLPVILKKYFSIDEEYRTSLKNVEGYNAQELMLQALDNIEKLVTSKKEDNNVILISELSIENRKLKSKKA